MKRPSEPPDTIQPTFSEMCDSFCRQPWQKELIQEMGNERSGITLIRRIRQRLRPKLEDIVKAVAEAWKIEEKALIDHGREYEIAEPRHAFFLIAKNHGYSNIEAATFLGRKDHSSTQRSCRRAVCLSESDSKYAATIAEASRKVPASAQLYFEAVHGEFWPILRVIGVSDASKSLILVESIESLVTMIRFEDMLDEDEINRLGKPISPVIDVVANMPPGSVLPVGAVADEAGLAYPAAWREILKLCHAPGADVSARKQEVKPYRWLVVKADGVNPLPAPPQMPAINRGNNPQAFQRRWNWDGLEVGDVLHMPGNNHNANRSQAIKACSKRGFTVRCEVHPSGGTLIRRMI